MFKTKHYTFYIQIHKLSFYKLCLYKLCLIFVSAHLLKIKVYNFERSSATNFTKQNNRLNGGRNTLIKWFYGVIISYESVQSNKIHKSILKSFHSGICIYNHFSIHFLKLLNTLIIETGRYLFCSFLNIAPDGRRPGRALTFVGSKNCA